MGGATGNHGGRNHKGADGDRVCGVDRGEQLRAKHHGGNGRDLTNLTFSPVMTQSDGALSPDVTRQSSAWSATTPTIVFAAVAQILPMFRTPLSKSTQSIGFEAMAQLFQPP